MSSLSNSQGIVVFLSFISMLKSGDADIVVRPKDVETASGTYAIFNCSSSALATDIQWNIYPIGKSMQVLYAYGKMNSQFIGRYTIENGHNLVISSVILDDAGTYECQDEYGHGEKQSAELIILESNPICQSNASLDKIMGKNTCGIEPSQVTLTCIVQYQGNKAPTMEWKKDGDEKPITTVVESVTKGNRVLHNLTLKGDSVANGSIYSCHLVKAATAATCNSGTITIIGQSTEACHCVSNSCRTYTDAIVCIIIILIPFFNAVAASITWRLFIHNPRKMRSSGVSGSPCKCSKDAIIFVLLSAIPFCLGLVLWYRCFYRRRLKMAREEEQKNRLVTENDQLEKEKTIEKLEMKNKTTEEMNNDLVKENEQLNAIVKDLYSRENIDYAQNPSPICTIAMNGNKSIKGMAVLENVLFVLFEKCSSVDVYNRPNELGTFVFQKNISIPEIQAPTDLTCWQRESAESCLLIVGSRVENTTKTIIVRLDLEGKLMEPWPKECGVEKGRLSTYESDLIVFFPSAKLIKEFSIIDGDTISDVKLDSNIIGRPSILLHAVKLNSIYYAASSTEPCNSGNVCSILIIDLKGNIIKTYKEEDIWNELEPSHHFIVDGDGSILAAEKAQCCISLLRPYSKHKTKLIDLGKGDHPVRLCFDETRKCLFIGTNHRSEDKSLSALVKIYKIKGEASSSVGRAPGRFSSDASLSKGSRPEPGAAICDYL